MIVHKKLCYRQIVVYNYYTYMYMYAYIFMNVKYLYQGASFQSLRSEDRGGFGWTVESDKSILN